MKWVCNENSAGKIKTTFYYSWISKLEERIIPPKGITSNCKPEVPNVVTIKDKSK